MYPTLLWSSCDVFLWSYPLWGWGGESGKEALRELSLGRNSSFVDLAANDFSPGLTVAPSSP